VLALGMGALPSAPSPSKVGDMIEHALDVVLGK
jgi:hypothetical protein